MYVWDHLQLSFPVTATAHHPHVETVQHRTTSATVITREFEADVRVETKQEAADGVVMVPFVKPVFVATTLAAGAEATGTGEG